MCFEDILVVGDLNRVTGVHMELVFLKYYGLFLSESSSIKSNLVSEAVGLMSSCWMDGEGCDCLSSTVLRESYS